MTGIAAWLERLGLGQYAGTFAANDVDLETLPHLTDDDLKELGLSLGHRRKLRAALEGGASAAPRAQAAPEDAAERRQLTVLFCDLAGSTELSERLDPEELRAVLGRYHDAVAAAVTAQDGHVAKLLGDGVLAYFGWPRAHEDDPERAVRAGLAAVTATAGIEVRGTPLAARAGIATGPVVVGDRAGAAQEAGAVSGATPNLAARLQALARPGEVMIHAATRRLVGAAFELEDRGAHALKGFSEPVPVWRVRGASRAESRFEARHDGPLTAFVGRSHEIGLLLDRWRQAAAGDGQVVLVSGEAGIGKSRILREFSTALAGEKCRILRLQCAPHEVNTAFHPLAAELAATAGIEPGEAADRRLDKLERHLDGLFDDRAALPLLAAVCGLPTERYPPLDLGPQRRRQLTVQMLADRIARLAARAPLVLLVEDVHWIDPSSREVLDETVRQAEGTALLVLITHRPEFQHDWGALGHLTVHSLNRLGRAERRRIAERVAGGKALPDEVLSRIVAQTDGIPLFVEELTKTVLEAGILEERADRYVLSGPLPALAIPETLQDSLMARLDRLSGVKRVVQAAACIGREFPAGLLGAALEMPVADLDAALGQLVEAELVFPRAGGGRYIFKHALVQDAAYASLLHAARRAMHERLARALEATGDPDDLELARHFRGAGANARAAALYLSGGRRLLARSNLPEAIGALSLGLEAAEALDGGAEADRLVLDLRVALGAARMANFGWAHASVSDALEPAFPLARAFGDPEALGSILWGLWVHYQTRTEFPRAHQWLAELGAAAEANGATDLPVVHDMSAGCQYFWEADYDRALAHTDRLKAAYRKDRHARIAELTNHDPLVFAQHWAGSLADWIAGRPDQSVERMDEALDLAREIGHPFNLVFALTAGSTSLLYLDQAERQLAHCDEAERVADEDALGPFSEHVNIMQWRGGALVHQGAFERGHALAKAGNDFWTASGGRICTAMFRSWMVLGLKGLGRLDEAIRINRANIEHCRTTGDRYMEPECLRLAGELALAAAPDDPARAAASFREAAATAQAHGARSWELRAATSLARLLRETGRAAEARAALEPVLESFTEGFATADLVAARALAESLG